VTRRRLYRWDDTQQKLFVVRPIRKTTSSCDHHVRRQADSKGHRRKRLQTHKTPLLHRRTRGCTSPTSSKQHNCFRIAGPSGGIRGKGREIGRESEAGEDKSGQQREVWERVQILEGEEQEFGWFVQEVCPVLSWFFFLFLSFF